MKIADSPFDSQHYGRRIGRLVDATGATLEAMRGAARAAELDLLVVRLAEADPLRAELERAGHAAIDVLVTSTLERGRARPPSELAADITIEQHDQLDAPAELAQIAAITDSITTSHLHADRRLPLEQTRRLYAAWACNDARGRAQRTIVARAGGAIVGYVTVLRTETTAVIDLVAVDPAWQGRGVGSAMLGAFIAWIAPQDVPATVGTQATNRALALYRRLGFVPTATHFTYHLWLDAGS